MNTSPIHRVTTRPPVCLLLPTLINAVKLYAYITINMLESKIEYVLLATARIATVGSETIGASGERVWHTRCAKQPPVGVVFAELQCRYVSASSLEWLLHFEVVIAGITDRTALP